MQAIVITHDTAFHADEAMATAMIELVEGPVQIIRTRDLTEIERISAREDRKVYVVDVGLVDNPWKLRFDHHQLGFERKYPGCLSSPMSSCGLVFLHLAENLFPAFADISKRNQFYYNFILSIDAHDNGIPQLKKEFRDKKPFLYYDNWTYGKLISSLNFLNVNDHQQQMIRFRQAVDLAKQLLEIQLNALESQEENETLNYQLFKEQMAKRTHPAILILDNKFPIKGFLRRDDRQQEIKFYIRQAEGTWQINTVAVPEQPLQPLIPLPDPEQARTLIGSDLIFAHQKQFVAKTHSLASCLALAHAVLESA